MPETTPAVIFDFDGTLADSFAELMATYERVAEGWGLPPLDPSRIDELRKLSHRELLAMLGIPLWKIPPMMMQVRAALRDRMTSLHPFPGIPELLEGLHARGVPLYVVSSNSEENIELFRKRHALPAFAGYRCSAGLFGKGRKLRSLIARERLDGPRSYYVGDEVRDVEAARSAGVRSISVGWGYGDPDTLRGLGPDVFVEKPEQIAAQVLDGR